MVAAEKVNGAAKPMLLKAENITLKRTRIEREVIPLGDTQVEVELAEVDLSDLKFDPTNPRVAFRLSTSGKPATQDELENLLWQDSEVRALKNSIGIYGGLIEAIIVANDGTVLEGNCRLASVKKLNDEAKRQDPRWQKVKARILAPGIDRPKVEVLLGELHFAGKNQWSPFEQAAHLYAMSQRGESERQLAGRYRQSQSYISAKLRAYALMRDKFVPLATNTKLDNPDRYWSWFEEFYKTCKPSKAGSEKPTRVYDGPALEEKFSEWVVNKKLPKAEQVRKLVTILENPAAMKVFEKSGIDRAMEAVAEDDPTINSKLWKQLQTTADMLTHMELPQLEALRNHDPAKTRIFEELASAVDRIRREIARA
ncbi:MAG: hypothetical protein JO340_15985 [Acidobacteriaceae bacterium]|nr:hypothetical protein [Acidobacteriaceae bacterium]